MADADITKNTIAPPSRAARRHLRRIFSVEATIRDCLDDTFHGTVGGESCPELRRALACLEAAVAALDAVRKREEPRFKALMCSAT